MVKKVTIKNRLKKRRSFRDSGTSALFFFLFSCFALLYNMSFFLFFYFFCLKLRVPQTKLIKAWGGGRGEGLRAKGWKLGDIWANWFKAWEHESLGVWEQLFRCHVSFKFLTGGVYHFFNSDILISLHYLLAYHASRAIIAMILLSRGWRRQRGRSKICHLIYSILFPLPLSSPSPVLLFVVRPIILIL